MLEHESALKIQGFFASYRLKKQDALQQLISTSPHSRLLQALDLRFQCMRAVAAAKFPINKPLEDREQVARVICSVTELAQQKGIRNLEAVAQFFQHTIVLSTRIQSPYYDLIWRKSHYSGRDNQALVNNAYAQLCSLVRSFDLPIEYLQEKPCFAPTEVLGLARDIIQYASNKIIEELANPTRLELDKESQIEFVLVIEKMLANYMTTRTLADSKEAIQSLTQRVSERSMH